MKSIIKKIANKIKQIVYYRKLKRNNIVIEYNANVDKNTIFEGSNSVAGKSLIQDCSIGIGTYIQYGCNLQKCNIGRWCSIAPEVKIITGNHPTQKIVTTHPAFYSNKTHANMHFENCVEFEDYSYVDSEKKWFCEIGNDVWIGERALILNGIKIGNGAIIGAGAIVTRDIPPYAVAVGVPAKVIKYRFTNDQIKKLEIIKWWENDMEWLKKNSQLFSNIDDFLGAKHVN